ncbi:hypothetical protein C1637_19205 [Chryseobacterium lactis]|uniref:RHS repeat protein n=2 Tax=Chryseobacterium lactis TaxID=1241981 RepID=A0A3G6RQ83_CHRLC|nr:hypothetical protein EG342_15620 [Chryseobacterium lactis]AZB03600.1 hypothetical protein EG341_06490 [Chryseobacterium lactis]PNW11894.1 hypothetical protein C1637_19205 [Chryseobacterium lactis]
MNYKNNFFPQSPNATPFALAGKYPVNMYKGVPSISIPLFSQQKGQSNFVISLDYNVKSIKPSTIPTWTGLGWNLNIGGSVTRIVNGGVDEVYTGIYSPSIPYNHFSYLDNYSMLDNPNWNTFDGMVNYYNINFDNTIINGFPTVVPSPDEFIININGITGSFYMNEKGKWVGRTKEGRTFKVEHQYKFDYKLPETVIVGTQYTTIPKYTTLKRILYGFNIIMDDGTKYIFGLDDTAIEFSSPPEQVDTIFNPHIIPASWQIKEIIYPDGKNTKFTYVRDERSVFVMNRSGNASWDKNGSLFSNTSNDNTSSSGQIYNISSNRLNNVFLTKVEGEDFIVNLERSATNQKEYDELEFPSSEWVVQYTHHIKSYTNHKHWYKLDKIKVSDKAGNVIKNIAFNYNNDPNDRLLLNNLSINTIEKYTFQYNNLKLPKYTTDQTDGWGYYNGNNFEPDHFSLYLMSSEQQKNVFQNVYPSYKQPNLTLTKAQTLEEITFPTGGKTYFEYELNDYSKYGEKNMNQTELLLYTTPAIKEASGGLRIKKIKSCNENSNCFSKMYSYVNDDGVSSSGILPYKAVYVVEGGIPNMNYSFWDFNYNSYQTLKDEDNSVGYSKVTEIDDNGGKKETYFTNFDRAGSNDKIGVKYLGWEIPALFKQLPYTSFSLMRGKPLKEIVWSDIKKVSETNYIYTQQQDHLRSYTSIYKRFSQNLGSNGFTNAGTWYGVLLDAHQINFNTSFLSEKKTFFDGVETKETNIYNNIYNTLISQTQTDASNNYTRIYSYAWDISNQAMADAYMVGIPVIEETKKNNKTISKKETIYPVSIPTSQTGSLVLPLSIKSFDLQNPGTSTTEVTYDKYDSKGNLQQYTTKDGISTTIIWGYNNTQPIAKIENVKLADINPSFINAIVAASETDAAAGANNDETDLLNAFKTFKNNLSGYKITTYSYDPLIGVRSITPPSGIRESYLYDSAGRLEKVINADGNLLKEFKYNYKQ